MNERSPFREHKLATSGNRPYPPGPFPPASSTTAQPTPPDARRVWRATSQTSAYRWRRQTRRSRRRVLRRTGQPCERTKALTVWRMRELTGDGRGWRRRDQRHTRITVRRREHDDTPHVPDKFARGNRISSEQVRPAAGGTQQFIERAGRFDKLRANRRITADPLEAAKRRRDAVHDAIVVEDEHIGHRVSCDRVSEHFGKFSRRKCNDRHAVIGPASRFSERPRRRRLGRVLGVSRPDDSYCDNRGRFRRKCRRGTRDRGDDNCSCSTQQQLATLSSHGRFPPPTNHATTSTNAA